MSSKSPENIKREELVYGYSRSFIIDKGDKNICDVIFDYYGRCWLILRHEYNPNHPFIQRLTLFNESGKDISIIEPYTILDISYKQLWTIYDKDENVYRWENYDRSEGNYHKFIKVSKYSKHMVNIELNPRTFYNGDYVKLDQVIKQKYNGDVKGVKVTCRCKELPILQGKYNPRQVMPSNTRIKLDLISLEINDELYWLRVATVANCLTTLQYISLRSLKPFFYCVL